MIGTMNTADRSIALVDAAMRRRFAFLPLHPEDQRLHEVLAKWLLARGVAGDRVDQVVDLYRELNRRIAEKDVKIGPSYLMTEKVTSDKGLDRIWRTAILPLLEEYYVGESVKVAEMFGLDTLQRAVVKTVPVSEMEIESDSLAESGVVPPDGHPGPMA